MPCPYCKSADILSLKKPTQLGYCRYRCRSCGKNYNERTGTPFNHLEYPTDIVFQVVIWRIRYKLSLRDIVEMCLMRGITLTHETVRDWTDRFSPYLTEYLKKRRQGACNNRWHVDETYIKVKGKWVYYYRAIDKNGNLVDSMMSERRNLAAAQRFLRQARDITVIKPECVTTDGLESYPRAIKRSCGRKVEHRTSKYMNNRIEQDHRGVKSRYKPMLGFKSFLSAAIFCPAYDEIRQHFRCQSEMKEKKTLSERRDHFSLQYKEIADAFMNMPSAWVADDSIPSTSL